MLKVELVPLHPLAVGRTEMMAVMGNKVILEAVKTGRLPVPDAARPIAVLLFVQAYVVPVTGLVNAMEATLSPLQNSRFPGRITVGVGLMVTVTFWVLVQLPRARE